MANDPQEHQLDHWKQAEGGHKAECKRLKAEKEAAAELAGLSLGAAAGPSGASASGRHRSIALRGSGRDAGAEARDAAGGSATGGGSGGDIQIG